MRIGADIVEVLRIATLKNQQRFIERVFDPIEQAYFKDKKNRDEVIAGHFALKEAVAKMLGTGIGPIAFQDIRIRHDPSGRPIVQLLGNAAKVANHCGIVELECTISHERKFALALAIAQSSGTTLKTDPTVAGLLRERATDGHKGTFGKVGIVAGSKGMIGSVRLATRAALRTGSGLVYAMVKDDIFDAVSSGAVETVVKQVEIQNVDETLLPMDAVAVGPGLGTGQETHHLLRQVLKYQTAPLVLDADALNVLSTDWDLIFSGKCYIILTPHVAEASRLLGWSVEEILRDRVGAASALALKSRSIVVLKGKETLVTDGEKMWVNLAGNDGMATAGSGDVLTGMLVSLLGQGYPPFQATQLAVHLHALAGDSAANRLGKESMMASDIIEHISHAYRALREQNGKII